MKIIRITGRKEDADAFNNIIKQNDKDLYLILHFFMKGCVHCENLEPKMKSLEEHMKNEPKYNNVVLGKIDADMMDSVNVENAYEFPTLKIIKNGETHQYRGAPEESAIITWINSLVKDNAATKGIHLSNHNSLGRRLLKPFTNKANAMGVINKKDKTKKRKTKKRKTKERKTKERKTKKRKTKERKTKKRKNTKRM